MYIYSSNDEAAIDGTFSELQDVANAISLLKYGETISFDASLDTEATPYDSLLNKIQLSCNGSKIKSTISNQVLNIELSEKSKEIVASYFSSFTSESTPGDHVHFDKYGNEEYMSQESLDVVIGIKQ